MANDLKNIAEEATEGAIAGMLDGRLRNGKIDIAKVLETRATRAVIEAKRVPPPPDPAVIKAEEDEIIAAAAYILKKRKGEE